MTTLITIIFFGFGLIIGSFLNVVICRYNTGRTFGGRSACMSCRTTLYWYELIPLVSFLSLFGRCRNCKTKISIQYPLVESATGVLFAGFFLKFQWLFFSSFLSFMTAFAFYAVIFSMLIIVVVYDLKHKIIPDILSALLAILTFFGLFLFKDYNLYPHLPSLPEFVSGLLMAFPFAFLWLVSRGAWMGLGDAKLAISLGWLLGPLGAFSAFVLAFWIGALVGIVLIFSKKGYSMRSEIPFAPYLVLGTLLVFFFQNLFPVWF